MPSNDSGTQRKEKRYRNWVFLIYPESAPPDWKDRLEAELTPGFISPLHERDRNPDGTPKKPHYHVVLTYHSTHSYKQVKEVTDALNAPHPQHVKDLRAQARYLCHMDNPEKEQYPASDVVCLCGTDYLEVTKSAADTDTAVADMMDWCVDNACCSFFELANYARENRSDWFRVITTQRTVFLTSWLKSMQWENSKREKERLRHAYARDKHACEDERGGGRDGSCGSSDDSSADVSSGERRGRLFGFLRRLRGQKTRGGLLRHPPL